MSSFRCSVSYKNNNKNSNFNQFFNFNHNVLFPSVSSMNHQSTTLICSMENSTEPNNALNLDFEPFPETPLSSNMINVSQFIQHTHTYSHRDRAIGIERVKDPALGRTMENYRPTLGHKQIQIQRLLVSFSKFCSVSNDGTGGKTDQRDLAAIRLGRYEVVDQPMRMKMTAT